MKRAFARLLLFFLLLFLPVAALGEEAALPVMQLHQINIPSTDCYVLLDRDTVILIDCGSNIPGDDYSRSPVTLLAYLNSLGFKKIDAHIITHWHNDHCYNVSRLNAAYGKEDTVVYGPSRKLPKQFTLKRGAYQQLQKGDAVEIGAFRIEVFGPSKLTRNGETNVDSLNFAVTYGKRRFVFTGDYMASASGAGRVDWFKFPHHGYQPYCMSSGTLAAIHPKIIFVPGNSRGSVLQMCKEISLSAKVYATDGREGYGTVALCDGDRIEVVENVKPGTFRQNSEIDLDHLPKGEKRPRQKK